MEHGIPDGQEKWLFCGRRKIFAIQARHMLTFRLRRLACSAKAL
jgi:hypothetical protein